MIGSSTGRRRGGFVACFVALTLLLAGVAPSADAATILYQTAPVAGYQTNGTVRAVLIVGDTVYVGGSFTQVRGSGGTPVVNRTNLAAFDRTTGALRTAFSADTNNVVRALASDGTALFVGGSFTTIKGVSRARTARVDLTTGNVATWTGNTTSHVYALALSGSQLYVGGAFGTAGGQPRGRIAAFDKDTGALSTTFNPNADATVHALAVSPDGQTVYAGGNFLNIGGGARSYLAALTTAGVLRPIAFQYLQYSVIDLDVSPDGTRVFAAQAGYGNQATSYNATTGTRQWFQQAEGDVQAVRYAGGAVYFSFHEGFAGDFTVRMLAADAQTGALEPAFRPVVNSFYGVWDIHSTYDTLVAGGEFTQFGGRNQQGFAILPTLFGPDPTPPTTPTNLAATPFATSVSLSWTGSTDNVALEGYQVLRDGVVVGLATGTTFTDSTAAGGSQYTYTVRALDVAGNTSGSSNSVTVNTPLAFVAPGASWRYLDNGSNQGTAWRAGGFNDGTWATGPMQLGYGDGDEATVVSFGPDAANKYRTTYFRYTFNVASPGQVLSLAARMIRDDGAVVYLNGTEVQRTNMPAGAITFTTFASTAVDGAAENVAFSINPSTLVAGTNTLAVEVHQGSAGSSDLSMSLELDATISAGDASPPTVPGNLTLVSSTASSTDLDWDAATDDVGVAEYVVYRDGTEVGTTAATSYTDSPLASSTTYSYQVAARDATGNTSALSAPLAATTRPATPTNLQVTGLTSNAVGLNWNDVAGATGYRVYRDGVLIGSPAASSYLDVFLPDGVTFLYSVSAVGAGGLESALAGPVSATTDDVTAPTVPESLAATSVQHTSVSLNWDPASDNVAVTGYRVLRDGAEVATVAGTTYTGTGLTPLTAYQYQVAARDAAGNESGPSAAIDVTTTEFATDVTPPSIPTGVAQTGATASSVTLSWNAATDDTGVTGYRIFRDGAAFDTSATTSYTDSGLDDGEQHAYAVSAFDGATNESTASAPVNARSLDVTAPTVPSGGAAVGASSTSITVTWNPSSDNVAVSGYRVRRDGAATFDVATTAFTDTGLGAATAHTYEVAALDAAGNVSPYSAPANGSTLAATVTLVPAGGSWRYLDNGSNQGTAWRASGFNDTSWATGTAQFGYGDGGEATVVSFGPNAAAKYITTYFRTTVTVANPAQVQSLTLLLLRDDGAVVYVNGVEAVRSNLPTGAIVNTTRATLNIEGAAENAWNSFTVPASALVSGVNTIAVEVHQNWAGSSDLSFDLQLIANQ